MRILDRYIIRSFALNYVIALAVLLSIYILLDLFFNFDEFAQESDMGAGQVTVAVVGYYGAHLFVYFAQISGVITLFAMAFTMLRLQRNNEFIAIVSSGVSLYRVALVVVGTGLVLNALWLFNQELIIPRLAPRLAQSHEAAALDKPYGVWFLRDRDGALLSASRFEHEAGQLSGILLMRRGEDQEPPEFIQAERGTWVADSSGQAGVWTLDRGARLIRRWTEDGAIEIEREPVDAFASALSPDDIALRQSTNWLQYLSRAELTRVQRHNMALVRQIARAVQNRFTTPIINMLILVIGIPIFLDRQPGSVVKSGGRCLVVCGACFLLAFFTQNATSSAYPTLTLWLPIVILTPIMVVTFDRMRT